MAVFALIILVVCGAGVSLALWMTATRDTHDSETTTRDTHDRARPFEIPPDSAQTPNVQSEGELENFGRDKVRDPEVYTAWPFDADEAKRRQRETAKALDQPEKITNSIGMTLKLIPAGEFLMGSSHSPKELVRTYDLDGDDARWFEDEGPQHRVRLTQPFYLGETEVTQGQWEAVMDTEPWSTDTHPWSDETYAEKGSDYAASYINWEDAVAFCERLRKKEGRTYRLPMAAEWEYACRAGSSTAYCFGDDSSELEEYAWFEDNAEDAGEKYAHEVGRKRANDFGLYDMHGNVWEWCADRYDRDYYGHSPTDDPPGPTSGGHRVYRGGCWSGYARNCRSANRNGISLGGRGSNGGFRVALVAAE